MNTNIKTCMPQVSDLNKADIIIQIEGTEGILCVRIIIKTSGSESRGQEEAAC